MIDVVEWADTLLLETAQPLPRAELRVGPRLRIIDTAISLGLFGGSLAIYNATLTPSLSYLSPDGNELITVAYTLGLAHSTGYPLYTWLGKLFTFLPIGDVAHRVNLMSAVLGAGGVALMYLVLLMLTQRVRGQLSGSPIITRMVAMSAALVFAFSPTFWSQAVISEVYAPNLFMVALQVLLILAWARAEEAHPTDQRTPPSRQSLAWFGAFCLVFALSTGTHASNLGFAPAYLVFVLAVNRRFAFRPRALVIGGGLFALGMLQHLWLPYRASTLVDLPMLGNAPTTLQGFYNYTLGAFPQFKFAFPLPAVPDRVVIYLNLLRLEFSLVGIVLGIVGLWGLLLKQPKPWWLLALMYLAHVIFFTQYRAFDLEVFFIPAHFLFALFIGMGAWLIVDKAMTLALRAPSPLPRAATYVAALLLTLTPPVIQLVTHYRASDHSSDVAINDFYANVFELLPQNAVLLSRGGVFGYDLFYWRLVYNLRPDVLIPQLTPRQAAPLDIESRPIYSTLRADGPGGGGGPWGIPAGLIGQNVWYIPVLVGNSPSTGSFSALGGSDLTLYALSEAPPDLFMSPAEAKPQVVVGESLGSFALLGYDLDASRAQRGGRLRLTFYWQGQLPARAQITTALGEVVLETHQPGFGNLQAVAKQTGLSSDTVLVEDYWIVIPSTLNAGSYPLRITVSDGNSIQIGTVHVTE